MIKKEHATFDGHEWVRHLWYSDDGLRPLDHDHLPAFTRKVDDDGIVVRCACKKDAGFDIYWDENDLIGRCRSCKNITKLSSACCA